MNPDPSRDPVLKAPSPEAEKPLVDDLASDPAPPVTEPFLGAVYGIGAALLGAAVWSGLAVLWEIPALLATPAMGWMVGWATLHGGRRPAPVIRALAYALSAGAAFLGLAWFCAFVVTQTSPDAGFQPAAVSAEYLKLFVEMPGTGTLAVLLSMAGAWRAVQGPRAKAARAWASRPAPSPARAAARPSDTRAA